MMSNKTTSKKKIMMKLSAYHLLNLIFLIIFQSSQFQAYQKKAMIVIDALSRLRNPSSISPQESFLAFSNKTL